MSTIHMPAQPIVDRVWTSDGAEVPTFIEWARDEIREGYGLPMSVAGGSAAIRWADLLDEYGEVYTEHPALLGLDDYPLPWQSDGTRIMDAHDDVVADLHDPALATTVARAVNEYAARAQGKVQ